MRSAAKHESQAVRIGAVVVLRRKLDQRVSAFLQDSNADVVAEAARAIYDTPIPEALPALAALLNTGRANSVAVTRRAMAAWCLKGGPEAVHQLSIYASNDSAPTELRLEALRHLKQWPQPPSRDPVLNMPRPTPMRKLTDLQSLAATTLRALLKAKSAAIQQAAAETASTAALESLSPGLTSLVINARSSAKVQVAALNALARIKVNGRGATARKALQSKNSAVRGAALNLVISLGGDDAASLVAAALKNGTRIERQLALSALGQMNTPETDTLLAKYMQLAIAGESLDGCLLELLQSTKARATASTTNGLSALLRRYESSKPSNEPLFAYAAALSGGDKERGRKIFVESTKAQCNRCHNLTAKKTELPGPDLTDVGNRLMPHEILESIALPNARIAEGFENVLIETKKGQSYAGRLLEETDTYIKLEVLDSGNAEVVKVEIERIASRVGTESSMLNNLIDQLSISELRDLVTFLSQLKKK
jgi:putative heme-binding domain-containing protein